MPEKYTILNASKTLIINAKAGLSFSEEQVAEPQKNSLKKFNIRAYNGGAVQLDTLPHPVVFDLATMQRAQTVPAFWNHDHNNIVGHNDVIDIQRGPQQWGVNAQATISGTNYRAKEIVANANNKYPWQVSVGVVTDNLMYYKAGEKFTANGATFHGPMFHALQPTLREISFCGIGADSRTSATLAASLKGSTMQMTFEEMCKQLGIDPAAVTPEIKAVVEKAVEVWNAQASTNANQTPNAQANGNVPPVVPAVPVPVNASTLVTLGASGVVDLIRSNAVAENNRITGIQRLAAAYKDTTFPANEPAVTLNANGSTRVVQMASRPMADAAIEAGWTPEQTEIRMLRASRNVNIVSVGSVEGPERFRVLEAAVSQTVKHSNVDKAFTPQINDAAHKQFRRGIGLQELILECAIANGYTGSRNFRGNHRAILEAAFSTIDISGILTNTTNKSLLEGASTVDDAWRKIAKVSSAKDFKAFASYRGVGYYTFDPVAPDGKIPHGQLTEEDYENRISTYGKMLAITRKDQINDDLNVLGSVPKGLARGGMLKLVKVFWSTFLNNSAFFAAGNSNVTTGVFGITGLSTADAKFRKQKSADGEYVMGTPKTLLVPGPLFISAETLMASANLVSGNTTAAGEKNPMQGKYEVVTSPYLDDSEYTGYSAVAYYLLADPNDVPVIEVAFLDGQETPTVESADVDFSQLGIQMRGYFDFGVALMDPRGGVRSTGA